MIFHGVLMTNFSDGKIGRVENIDGNIGFPLSSKSPELQGFPKAPDGFLHLDVKYLLDRTSVISSK